MAGLGWTGAGLTGLVYRLESVRIVGQEARVGRYGVEVFEVQLFSVNLGEFKRWQQLNLTMFDSYSKATKSALD
jgi:hypothetical protein